MRADQCGHSSTHVAANGWTWCRACGQRVAPRDGALPGPPPPGPVPAGAADAGQGGLTVQDLGFLKLAGRWGMLRQQSGRRFLLAGSFTLSVADLGRLIEAAGGQPVRPDAVVLSSAGWMRDAVDVLVCGEGASPMLRGMALDAIVPCWDEADLVLELLPTHQQLTAPPG